MKTENLTCVPKVRFPGFDGPWEVVYGNEIFAAVSEKNNGAELPLLALSQDQGAIPRSMIDYHVIVSEASKANYKIVRAGDFIISLRSFQGGIEYSCYDGLCSPAYIILRNRVPINHLFYKYYFKTAGLISALNRNLEGIRDGKMVSYKQFSEIKLPFPSIEEQQKIASCLSSIDDVIDETERKITALKEHKKGMMQKLFPVDNRSIPEILFTKSVGNTRWNSVFLGDAFDMRNGYTPSKSEDKFWNNGNIPWFRMEDIRKYGRKLSDSIQHITSDAVKGKLFPANSIILATTATIGEHALIMVDSLANQRFTCLSVNEQYSSLIDIHYFYQYMFVIDGWCIKNANHGGMDSVDIKTLKQFIFPLPDIEQQQKIASCLSSIDELITAYEEKLTLLKLHKKGLMQRLFPISIH